MAKQLFDRSMDELREAFVRNRFAEDQIFGMPDIEGWLEEQKGPGILNLDAWHRFLVHLAARCAENPLDILRDCATKASELSRAHLSRTYIQDEFGTFFSLLNRELYLGGGGGSVSMCVGDRNVLYVVLGTTDTEDGLTIKRVDRASPLVCGSAVASVLFAEWASARPKWKAASGFLCDNLEVCIAEERARAEEDFNRAVAVSADGTRIVHADWVVVFGGREHEAVDFLFPAAAFAESKIKRDVRSPSSLPKELIGEVRKARRMSSYQVCRRKPKRSVYGFKSYGHRRWDSHARPQWYRRQLFEARELGIQLLVKCEGDTSILFLHREHCPDPLSEGALRTVRRLRLARSSVLFLKVFIMGKAA